MNPNESVNLSDTQIGINIYTLRAHCKDEQSLDTTLGRLADIGYRAIEVAALDHIGAEGVRALLDKHELFCCGSHEGLDAVTKNRPQLLEKLSILGTNLAVLAHPGNDFWSAEGVAALGAKLQDAGLALREREIVLAYHNHAAEFERFDGRVWLDELFMRTSAYALASEIDVHWVARGGASPAAWIRRLSGRIAAVHVKDLSIVANQPVFSEVGEGNLEWSEILLAADESDAPWFIVEQDQPFGDRDIFESAAISYRNLIAMGIQ